MRCFVLALIAAGLVAGPARASVQCWYENGAVVVPARVGDITGDFVLDTSAPHSQVHLTTAQMDGVEDNHMNRDLEIAGRTFPSMAFEIVDLDERAVGFPSQINGVLGADILGDYVLDLSFEPCRVGLTPRAETGAGGGRRLPVRAVAGVPAIEATISDGHTARMGAFAIDTASAGVRLPETIATLARPPPRDPSWQFKPLGRLAALTVYEEPFEAVPASLMKSAPEGLSGALGLAVLARWRLRLDVTGGWMEIQPSVSASSARPAR